MILNVYFTRYCIFIASDLKSLLEDNAVDPLNANELCD